MNSARAAAEQEKSRNVCVTSEKSCTDPPEYTASKRSTISSKKSDVRFVSLKRNVFFFRFVFLPFMSGVHFKMCALIIIIGSKTIFYFAAEMKVKRFFANVIVLVIFAAVVFFAGWVQFAVKPGSCALMESKTGGLYSKPIVPGVFAWRWERLLPTNVTLTKFTLTPQKETATVSGVLPSGELYASFLGDKTAGETAVFSYSVTADVSLSFSPEAVHSLFSQGKIATDDDLKSYSATAASLFVSLLAQHLIETGRAVQSAPLSQEEINSIVQKNPSDFEGISLLSAQVTSSLIPDIALYERLKAECSAYLDLLNDKTGSQSVASPAQDSAIVRLEQLGEVLSKYPQLEELFKTEEGSRILRSLNLAD